MAPLHNILFKQLANEFLGARVDLGSWKIRRAFGPGRVRPRVLSIRVSECWSTEQSPGVLGLGVPDPRGLGLEYWYL